MHLVIHQDFPGVVRLELHGHVDQEDVAIFERECLNLMQQGWRHFCVDFTPCSRLEDSLLHLFRPLQQAGAHWQFIAPQPRIFHWLQQLRFPVSLQAHGHSHKNPVQDLSLPF